MFGLDSVFYLFFEGAVFKSGAYPGDFFLNDLSIAIVLLKLSGLESRDQYLRTLVASTLDSLEH